jgi:8-amino-7-oxononanoate synthase
VDLSSNDYIGLARCPQVLREAEVYKKAAVAEYGSAVGPFGSTGSRLLSGNSAYHEAVETR